MGFAASQARLLMLTARKSDLELELQIINQARMNLANTVGRISDLMSKNSARYQSPSIQNNRGLELQIQGTEGVLQGQLNRIQATDKIFEMNAQRVEKQHTAVETEIAAVNKVINKNIQMSFKLMG